MFLPGIFPNKEKMYYLCDVIVQIKNLILKNYEKTGQSANLN